MGRVRQNTRAQSEREPTYSQRKFTGENRDLPESTIDEGELPILENAIAYGDRIEARPGYAIHQDYPSWPGTGTVWSRAYNPAIPSWIIHQGQDIFVSYAGPVAVTESTLYGTTIPWAYDQQSQIVIWGDKFIVSVEDFVSNTNVAVVVDPVARKYWFWLYQAPYMPIWDNVSGSNPYRYRYLYTWARIVDGIVELETGTTSFSFHKQVVGTDLEKDYGEQWSASPAESGLSFYLTDDGSNTGDSLRGENSSPYTHFRIYRTLDIGVNGIDPLTGEGNSSEIYVWTKDVAFTSATGQLYTEDVSDDTLRARMAAGGYLCKSRFFEPIPPSRVIAISSGFFFAAANGGKTLYYSQLDEPRFIGWHNPALQKKTFDAGINHLRLDRDRLIVLHTGSITVGNLAGSIDAGDIEPVFVLNSWYPLNGGIGVVDWGSIAETEDGGFIARCDDGTIRQWMGDQFGPDLADRARSKIVKTMRNSSSAGVLNGAYFLFFQTTTVQANDQCIRLALKPSAGIGWSTYTGYPQLMMRGGVIKISDNGNVLLSVLAFSGNISYRIETYNGSHASVVRLDVDIATAIPSKIRFRDLTGPGQNDTCRLLSMRPMFRPIGSGSLSGFTVGADGYADGVLAESVEGASHEGDIEFWDRVEGRRVAGQLRLNQGGWVLTGVDFRYLTQDRRNITSGPSTTPLGLLQDEIASGLLHWFTRGESLLKDRVTGDTLKYDGLTTISPVSTTAGPDGKSDSAILYTFAGSNLKNWMMESTATLPGDFSVMFWLHTLNHNYAYTVFSTSEDPNYSLSMELGSATTYLFIGGDEILAPIGIADGVWHLIYIRRESGVAKLQIDAGTTYTQAAADPISLDQISFGHATGPANDQSQRWFDIRFYDKALSTAAKAYLYDDVLNNAGMALLPLF